MMTYMYMYIHLLICVWHFHYREQACTGVLGRGTEHLSVSAVPALRVTTKSVLDDSIGEVCDVLVGRKKHPGRVAAIGKVVYVYSVRTMCTVKTD